MKTIAAFAAMLLLSIASFAADAPAPPAEGTAAPKFTLPSQDAPAISLDQFKGKWVVLYFYPKDFTSAAPSRLTTSSVTSPSTRPRTRSWSASASIPPTRTRASARKRTQLQASRGHRTQSIGAVRLARKLQRNGVRVAQHVLIDPSGVIRKVYLKVKPPAHSDEVLADLDTLQAKK